MDHQTRQTGRQEERTDDRLRLRDIPIATRPGQPGITYYADGSVGIPIGLNVRAKSLRSNTMFAHIQSRKKWEEDKRSGGRNAPDQLMMNVMKCSYCQIIVGRGYFETELYIYPTIGKGCLEWHTLCASCAVEVYQLPFHFCLIAERDWTGGCEEHIVGERFHVRELKKYGHDGLGIPSLEEQIVEDWNKLEYRVRMKWKEQGNPMRTFPRTQLFGRWLQEKQYKHLQLTFTDIYTRIQQQEAQTQQKTTQKTQKTRKAERAA